MKGKAKVKEAILKSSSEDESDDEMTALLVRNATKMLKKLNKKGIKFDSKKFFTSSKRKPISKMNCYNCGDLGHLAHQCSKPKKDKFKNKNKGKKDDSSNEGHFAHECQTSPPQPLPKHARPFTFNAHYMLRKDTSGKMKVMFLEPPNKNMPKKIWVAKSLVEKVKGPQQVLVPKA